MANPNARLAEAYTCFFTVLHKVTDLGLSYSVRGEISDAYESTPNSGAFTTYFADLLGQRRHQSTRRKHHGLPTLTYGLDGEGRPYTVSASSGQNPVSGTTYNSAGLPTAINLGSGPAMRMRTNTIPTQTE